MMLRLRPRTQVACIALASAAIFLFHAPCRAGVSLSVESHISAEGVWKLGLPGLPPFCNPGDAESWSICRQQNGPYESAIGSTGGVAHSGVDAFNARAQAVAVAEAFGGGESGGADFEFLSSVRSTWGEYDRGDGVMYGYGSIPAASSSSATIEVDLNISVPSIFKWKAVGGDILTGFFPFVQELRGEFLQLRSEQDGWLYPSGVYTLSPGNYTIVMTARGNVAATPNGPPADAYSWTVFSWTTNDVFVGQEPTNPVPPRPNTGTLPQLALPASYFADADLGHSFPVEGSLGRTASVYVGMPTEITDGPNAGADILGYCFQSRHAAVSSVVVPELPAGTDELTLRYDGGSQVVVPGETIEIGPTGTDWFSISGLDPAFASDAPDALVLGVTFAADGAARLFGFGQGIAGDVDLDGDVDAADIAKFGSSFGLQSDSECSRRDLDLDGAVSLADLAMLQTHLGQIAATAQAATPVPELSSFAYVLTAMVICGLRRTRLRRSSAC